MLLSKSGYLYNLISNLHPNTLSGHGGLGGRWSGLVKPDGSRQRSCNVLQHVLQFRCSIVTEPLGGLYA